MLIRPEQLTDYSTIARIHYRAFDARLGEGLIVLLQRQRQTFDAELSIVAEIDGEVVGHALFIPSTIQLLGQAVPAVNLAPIGIDPRFQKQGIGSALMQEGHRIAQAKGYQISYLLGHIEYYPRFGYITEAFGASSVEVNIHDFTPDADAHTQLTTRSVTESDVLALMSLWQHEESNVDFAIHLEPTLFDWRSPNPLVASNVYCYGDEVVGYTRINTMTPTSPAVFLSANERIARLMLYRIHPGSVHFILPLHPNSASSGAFENVAATAWGAGMAKNLDDNSPFVEYLAQVQANQRPVGRPVWGTAFDFDH